MLRRRAPRATEDRAARTARLAPRLHEAGWVLPSGLGRLTGADRSMPPPEERASSTRVGTVDSTAVTAVDPRGLVGMDGWSLDWWIGAEDRWHLPALEVAVRQSLVGSAPVVETLVRVPGGDAVQRVYGIRGEKHAGGDEYVVVEVENRSKAPFAVVWAVRPFDLDGVGRIGSITVEPIEGGSGRDVAHLVRLDGCPALVLPRRPARAAASNLAGGDMAAVVLAGDAPEELPAAVDCDDDLAQAAFVVPVPHTAALRVVIPIGTVRDDPAVPWPPVIPTADHVASGWAVQSRRGVAVDLPDPRLVDAFTASRRFLLLAHRSPQVADGSTPVLLRAMGRLGLHDEVGRLLLEWVAPAAAGRPTDRQLLAVAADHWRLSRDVDTIEEALPDLAACLERVGRDERRGRLGDATARRSARTGVDGFREVLAGIGQPEAAGRVDELVRRLGPVDGPVDGPAGERSDATGGPVDPRTELEAAADLLAAGDAAGLALLAGVLDAASSTWTWPAPIGSGPGTGHDPAVGAMLVDVVRTLLVSENAEGLTLLPVFPPHWYGGGVQVDDAPTSWGLVSYAVRWHGDRPALLWDVRPHEGLGPVRLTCPGLDPAWSSTETRGDALLTKVPAPQGG
jgi:hypothetical protein